MILSLRLRYPTLHPKQTWRSTSTSILYPSPNYHSNTPHIKTTKHNISSPQPMPILTTRSSATHTNMNWRSTSRTPLHHYWTTSIDPIFPNPTSPYTLSQYNRKLSIKMKSPCSISHYPGLVNQRREQTSP